jgi:hypothetical protein
MTISTESIVVAVNEQLSCDLQGEAVVLHLNSGKYFGFEAVAALIWSLVQQPRRVGEIRDAVLERYDVAQTVFERDLLDFLNELQEAGLIEVKDA